MLIVLFIIYLLVGVTFIAVSISCAKEDGSVPFELIMGSIMFLLLAGALLEVIISTFRR